MASFTPNEVILVPNLSIMTTMALVFLLNLWIIKKFMLEPYLKLREKRESLTSGSQEQVKRLREQIVQMQDKIDSSIKQTVTEAKKSAASQREEALAKSEQLIHTAKLEAAAALKESREKIAQRVIEQRSKLPGKINEISDIVFNSIMT